MTLHPRFGRGFGWQAAGFRYFPLRYFVTRAFGGPIRKVSIDIGAGCPNRDGKTGLGGCVFCDPASFSPSRRLTLRPVGVQIADALRSPRPGSGNPAEARVLAYFQPGTNTYAPLAELRRHFYEAASHSQVSGLIVGTRPDCLDDGVLDLLAELADRTWLTLELGLQSIHDKTLERIRRGHDYAAFLDAVGRARQRGLRIGVHVILGLPGEGREEMIATAQELARLKIESVKIHNLYAAKGTLLAEWVAEGKVVLPERDAYVAHVVDFLERLHSGTVIDRLSAAAPDEYLAGPRWCLDKAGILRAIDAELARRDTWQGRLLGP